MMQPFNRFSSNDRIKIIGVFIFLGILLILLGFLVGMLLQGTSASHADCLHPGDRAHPFLPDRGLYSLYSCSGDDNLSGPRPAAWSRRLPGCARRHDRNCIQSGRDRTKSGVHTEPDAAEYQRDVDDLDWQFCSSDRT
jgi:hypothetical protein